MIRSRRRRDLRRRLNRSRGVSSCISSVSASKICLGTFRWCSGVRLEFARGATAMLFWPFSPTKIKAMPVGARSSRVTQPTSMPSRAYPWTASSRTRRCYAGDQRYLPRAAPRRPPGWRPAPGAIVKRPPMTTRPVRYPRHLDDHVGMELPTTTIVPLAMRPSGRRIERMACGLHVWSSSSQPRDDQQPKAGRVCDKHPGEAAGWCCGALANSFQINTPQSAATIVAP